MTDDTMLCSTPTVEGASALRPADLSSTRVQQLVRGGFLPAGTPADNATSTGTRYGSPEGRYVRRPSPTTKLTNTKGTALSFAAPRSMAPLAVSNDVRIARLNADKLDGLDLSVF